MDLGIEKQRKQTIKQTQGKHFPTPFPRFKASQDSSQSLQRGNGWHRSLGSAHSGFFLLLLLILALIALLWCGFLHRPQSLQGHTSSSIGLSMGCSPLACSASFKCASPSMPPSVSPSECLLLYLHVSPPLSPFASPHMPPFGLPAATALSYVCLSRGTVCSSDQLRSWHRLGLVVELAGTGCACTGCFMASSHTSHSCRPLLPKPCQLCSPYPPRMDFGLVCSCTRTHMLFLGIAIPCSQKPQTYL